MAKKTDRRKKDHYVDFYSCSLSYQGDSCKRKKRGRVRYLNWALERSGMSGILERGYDFDEGEDQEKIKRDQELEKRVHEALTRLDETEREFILYFYFDCFSYERIESLLKKRKDKLQRIHQRALDKLELILKDFVEKRFKLKTDDKTVCIICQNPHREELDRIILSKRKQETWKRIIKILNEKYHLRIKTPQILIGHARKHMIQESRGWRGTLH